MSQLAEGFDKNASRVVKRIAILGTDLPKEPGRFRYIRKADLLIDHSYQRNPRNHVLIKHMADNWSWPSCLTLGVVERCEKFYVFDGQQRKLAADRLNEITELPCMVFTMDDDIKKEASAFLQIQVGRKPVTAVEKFRAELVVGDPVATAIEKIVTTNGFTVSPSAGSGNVRCIAACRRLYMSDAAVFADAFACLATLTRSMTNEYLLRAVFYLAKHGVDIKSRHFSKRIAAVGEDHLISKCKAAVGYHNATSDRICAEGFLNAYNHGCRNRIELPDGPAGWQS